MFWRFFSKKTEPKVIDRILLNNSFYDADLINRILQKVTDCNNNQFVEYETQLLKNPATRPILAGEEGNDYDKTLSVLKAISQFDRLSLLTQIFNLITVNCTNEKEVIEACLTFTQKYFFWHFGSQPLFKANIIQDPIANILLQSARCGTSARFLIDLLLVGNIKAGLLGGAAHTSAVVFFKGCWRIIDTSLYPPGVYPQDAQGDFLSLDEVLMNPQSLDKAPSYINFNEQYIDLFLSLYPELQETAFHEMSFVELLRMPLLPSSGYFARDFFIQQQREPELQIICKTLPIAEFNLCSDFGWKHYAIVETFKAPDIKAVFRPSSVQNILIKGSYLVWDKPLYSDKDNHLIYEIIVSQNECDWSYRKFKVGCNFSLDRVRSFITSKNKISLNGLRKYGNYVNIIAKYNGMQDLFFHPSQQIRISTGN